jgi:WD40 repeat protein
VIGSSVYVWLSDRSRGRTVDAPAGKILALAYSPDSARYASAHQDGQIRIWHVRSHRSEKVRTCSSNSVMALAWSRDGQRLVAGDASGKVMILDS